MAGDPHESVGETGATGPRRVVTPEATASVAGMSRRVVSVSPATAQSPAPPRETFVTPRVIDQTAFDELAGTLRALLDEAARTADALNDRMRRAQELDREPVRASGQLQERLRLGARMLKAFQSQIDGVDAAVGRMTEQETRLAEAGRELDTRLAAFGGELDAMRAGASDGLEAAVVDARASIDAHVAEQIARLPQRDAVAAELNDIATEAVERVETRVAAAETRLQELTDAAVARLDAEAAERRNRMDAANDRLAELERRMGELTQIMETAEVNEAALTSRIGALGRDVEKTSEETSASAARAAEAAAALDRAHEEAAARIGELAERATEIVQSMDRRLEVCEAAARRVELGIEDATRTAVQLDQGIAAGAALEPMLEQLAPWRELLLESERGPDGTPRAVTRTIEALRTSLGQDMAKLSVTMREIAERVDRFTPAKGFTFRPSLPSEDKKGSVPTVRGAQGEIEPKPPLRLTDHGGAVEDEAQ